MPDRKKKYQRLIRTGKPYDENDRIGEKTYNDIVRKLVASGFILKQTI